MSYFKPLILLAVCSFALTTTATAQDLPATAQPGKCYVKCITPDEYKDITETIQVKPAYKVLKTIPATYKMVDERVLIKEAAKRFVYHPAVYETVNVNYESKADAKRLEVVPARFGTDTKSIEVHPKFGRWEYTQLADCPSANKEDCMVACFVEYPEKVESFKLTTLLADATTKEVALPGASSSYKKQVIKTAARMEEIEIPAEYATIKKSVVDKPAQVVEELVAAETKTVTKRELVKKGGMTVWEEVDCNIVGTNNVLPILYELNSARLTADSERIIDQNLLKLLNDKPGLRVEIMSHTDSRGNDDYNMSLSQQRAQSVVNHLVSKGISRSRLVAKGYGETRLKNKCANGVQCSEEDHHQNRRTEFRILQ